jgi:hypothetical protein
MTGPSGDIINCFNYAPQTGMPRWSGTQLAAIAQAFATQVLAAWQPVVSANIKFIDVVVNDLWDSLGQQGSYAYPTGTVGLGTGTQLPMNSALAGTWRTRFRGPRYRGRSFFGGFVDSTVAGDQVGNGLLLAIAALQLAVANFSGTIAAPIFPVVASRVHQLLTPVAGMVLTAIIDTMKRRLATHGR